MKRFRTSLPVALVAFAVAALLLASTAGCAADGGASPPSSAATNTGNNPTATPPTQATNDMRQRTDLHDEHASLWSRYEVVSDHSVRVFFYMGDPQCYGVRAAIDEDATTVRIALYEGTLPDAPSVCAELAVSASLVVATRDPVGTRSVIPGD